MKKQRMSNKKWFVLGTFLGGVLLVATTALVVTMKPVSRAETDAQLIRETVGRLVVLPTNEEPAITTISEEMRASDKFLQQAQDGDKLLLYYKSLKAYIYRPSIKKVVDIGPLTVDPSAEEVQGARIVLVDGSGQPQKTADYHTRLAAIYKDATVSQLNTHDTHHDHATTVVVDLTDDNQKYNLVNNIAATLGGRRGTLPFGETAPANTDILIIVGKE
jgi:hypothetical protein